MDLLGSCGFYQLHDFFHGGATDDGVVHDDDFFILEHALHGIELDANPEVAAGLDRPDEGSSHVMVADKADIKPDA